MKYSALLFSMIALLAFTGCQKDDPPAPPTKTELISRNWKITAASGTFPPLPAVDLLAQTPACKRDNIVQIKSDGTYVEDEGASKCNSTDPQTASTGNWSFTTNETKLNILGQTFDIITLTATTLVLKQDVAAAGGLPAGTINTTLTAQ